MYEGLLYSNSIVEITNTQNRYSNSEKEEYFMGVWEEIWDKTKDVANAAGKKTGEIVEISKYKIQVAQINGDIRSQYEKLGNAVYNMVKADYENPELVNSIVDEIDDLLDHLKETEDKIAELKKVIKCPCCGYNNPQEASYCSKCGCKLEQQEKSDEIHVEPAEEQDWIPEETEQPQEN